MFTRVQSACAHEHTHTHTPTSHTHTHTHTHTHSLTHTHTHTHTNFTHAIAEHNVAVEHVKVATIEVGEKVRTKLVTKNGPKPEVLSGVTIPTGVESALGKDTAVSGAAEEGDTGGAADPTDKPGVVSTVDRDYKFEEMFIEHPDLFTLNNKIKELVRARTVTCVWGGGATVHVPVPVSVPVPVPVPVHVPVCICACV
jgi:hypothetical protein